MQQAGGDDARGKILERFGELIASAERIRSEASRFEDDIGDLSVFFDEADSRAFLTASLNNDPARSGAYARLVQKRITALADIRNNADHGRMDQFTRDDVEDMLKWVQRFAADHLK
jgi:hypothetical protein